MADQIGTEIPKTKIDHWVLRSNGEIYSKLDGHGRERRQKKPKEYPPTIPSLVRTEKKTVSHPPWFLLRYYTDDGRLILKEAKVKHQEYFKTNRSNGRLTLQLMSLNANVLEVTDSCEKENERNNNAEIRHDGSDANDRTVGSDPVAIGDVGDGGVRGKCYYRSSANVFGLSVSPFRPIHI